MAKFLHKIGAFAFNHPWQVIASWVVVLGILGFGAHLFMKPPTSAISIPGTEAQKAIDRAKELFPKNGKGTGRIVFQAKNGTSLTDYKTSIQKLVGDVATIDGVSAAIDPFSNAAFIDTSGTIGYATVQLLGEQGSVKETTISAVEKKVAQTKTNDLDIEIGGGLINNTPGEIIGIGEVFGVIVALAVLLMTLGSLVSAGMPIVTALIAVGVSTAGLFSLSQLISIGTTTPVLGVMLGLAVGIDYSLFIINRYRMLALEGHNYRDAAARAIATAGNAVVFAALTVVIALAALSIVNIPFMTTMGLAGAASIAVAALVAISVVPALLRLAGDKVFGKKQRSKVIDAQTRGVEGQQSLSRDTFWYRWGGRISKRPVAALIGAIVVIALVAFPAKDLTLGLPTDEFAATSSTERKAYDLITKGFGVGYNGPLAIVVEGLPKVSQADAEYVRAQAQAEFNRQVATATSQQEAYFNKQAAMAVTYDQQVALQQEIIAANQKADALKQAGQKQIDQTVAEYAKFVQLKNVSDRIAELDDVKLAAPVQVTADGTAGIIQVVPKTAPTDSDTIDLINTLRSSSTQKEVTKHNGATLAVTGTTALQNDINKKLAAALPEYLAVVVGLSLVLLIVAFRSILVPLKATLGFLLSVAAMFGAVVAVFQWGWFGLATAPGPIISFIPIISIGVLFGLAMDYEFFLVSGMHESYVHTKNAREAVIHGFGAGGKVVAAAGAIMVSVFAGFISNHDSTIQAIGFGLAIGILVDAFLVRMTIVPALMTLLGRAAWWLPKWLDRIVPHVSIEGEDDKNAR